jgi:hypothetical protein
MSYLYSIILKDIIYNKEFAIFTIMNNHFILIYKKIKKKQKEEIEIFKLTQCDRF